MSLRKRNKPSETNRSEDYHHLPNGAASVAEPDDDKFAIPRKPANDNDASERGRPLWNDYARPNTWDQLSFHDTLDAQLRHIATSKRDALPNLLFYGPRGAGKRTRVNLLLRQLFTPDASDSS